MPLRDSTSDNKINLIDFEVYVLFAIENGSSKFDHKLGRHIVLNIM